MRCRAGYNALLDEVERGQLELMNTIRERYQQVGTGGWLLVGEGGRAGKSLGMRRGEGRRKEKQL